MMFCPSCSSEMIWHGSNEVDKEVYVNEYSCYDCKLEVNKYYGDNVDDFI